MDILYHIIAGLIIYIISHEVIGFRVSIALLFVLLAGLCKELYDLTMILNYSTHYLEPVKDITMTMIGGILGLFNPFKRTKNY